MKTVIITGSAGLVAAACGQAGTTGGAVSTGPLSGALFYEPYGIVIDPNVYLFRHHR